MAVRLRTPLEIVIDALAARGKKPRGNQQGGWSALCPAHDDTTPSLSIGVGGNGQALVHCHTGCTYEQILAALDLTEADLFPEDTRHTDDITATYDYLDELGNVLFQVVRKPGKQFRQRRPDGAGGWIWKLGDTRRVLYRLPDLLEAVAAGDPVFIVEGEKDVDRLIADGYDATCNPHGAGKWRSSYNATLKGADIIIVADRDDNGRAHARDIALALDGVASSVRVVEAAAGKDVSDHLAAGRTVEELVSIDIDQHESDPQVRVTSPNSLNSPSDMSPWPTLDETAYYGPIGDTVHTLGPHTEADPAAVLATLLTGWGATLTRGPHANAGHVEHAAHLSVVIVGETAKARKGTSWATTRLVLNYVDLGFMDTRVLGGFGSGESVVDEVRDAQPNDDPDKPQDPGADDKRLLILEPEFARVLKVCARESSVLSTIIRDAWDGSRLQTRARIRKAVATGHHIAMVGHITVPELRRNLNETEIAGGFANRILWICAKRSKRLPFGDSLNAVQLKKIGMILSRARDAALTRELIDFTPDARDRWSELYHQMADDDPGGLLGAIVARPEPQCLRLALTYALLDRAQGITPVHIDAAWALWTYSRDSAAYIWGDAVGDEIADALLKAIRRSGSEGMDLTAQSAEFARKVPAKRLATARDELERRGLIEMIQESTDGRPRNISRAKAK